MFGTSLTEKQGHLLCAIAVSVYIHDEFQPLTLEVTQSVLGNFYVSLLISCQDNVCFFHHGNSSFLDLLYLTSCDHCDTSSRSPISPYGHSDTPPCASAFWWSERNLSTSRRRGIAFDAP